MTPAELVKEYILLSLVCSVLQKDYQTLAHVPLRFKQPYLLWLEKRTDQAKQEWYALRRRMRQENLWVYEQKRNEKGITVRYKHRRYHYRCDFLYAFLSAETQRRIVRFFDITDSSDSC